MERIEFRWADGTSSCIEDWDECLTLMSDDYWLEDILDSYEQEYYEKKETA